MIRLAIVFVSLLAAAPSFAAGNGSGAGGAGAQHGIHSGRSAANRPPGPLGAVNNPRRSPAQDQPASAAPAPAKNDAH
jgi:hypothetical protein